MGDPKESIYTAIQQIPNWFNYREPLLEVVRPEVSNINFRSLAVRWEETEGALRLAAEMYNRGGEVNLKLGEEIRFQASTFPLPGCVTCKLLRGALLLARLRIQSQQGHHSPEYLIYVCLSIFSYWPNSFTPVGFPKTGIMTSFQGGRRWLQPFRFKSTMSEMQFQQFKHSWKPEENSSEVERGDAGGFSKKELIVL